MDGTINEERRALLKATALAGVAGTLLGIPILPYVVAPALQTGRGAWFNFGAVESVGRDAIKMLLYKFIAKDGWVTVPRQGVVWAKADVDGTLTVFSSVCPHLGCSVRWREQSKSFECPCHSGRFDAQGRPTAGPPTKPLMVLEHKVENGELHVLLPV